MNPDTRKSGKPRDIGPGTKRRRRRENDRQEQIAAIYVDEPDANVVTRQMRRVVERGIAKKKLSAIKEAGRRPKVDASKIKRPKKKMWRS